MPELLKLTHPEHGEAVVDLAQWNEVGHVTGWDEASARAAGWSIVGEEQEEEGQEEAQEEEAPAEGEPAPKKRGRPSGAKK
jgi:hypothetical protein